MQVINIFLRKTQIFTQHFASSSEEVTDPRGRLSLSSGGTPQAPPSSLEFCRTEFEKPLLWVRGVSFLSYGESLKLKYQVLDFWILMQQILYTYAAEIWKTTSLSIHLAQGRHHRHFPL